MSDTFHITGIARFNPTVNFLNDSHYDQDGPLYQGTYRVTTVDSGATWPPKNLVDWITDAPFVPVTDIVYASRKVVRGAPTSSFRYPYGRILTQSQIDFLDLFSINVSVPVGVTRQRRPDLPGYYNISVYYQIEMTVPNTVDCVCVTDIFSFRVPKVNRIEANFQEGISNLYGYDPQKTVSQGVGLNLSQIIETTSNGNVIRGNLTNSLSAHKTLRFSFNNDSVTDSRYPTTPSGSWIPGMTGASNWLDISALQLMPTKLALKTDLNPTPIEYIIPSMGGMGSGLYPVDVRLSDLGQFERLYFRAYNDQCGSDWEGVVINPTIETITVANNQDAQTLSVDYLLDGVVSPTADIEPNFEANSLIHETSAALANNVFSWRGTYDEVDTDQTVNLLGITIDGVFCGQIPIFPPPNTVHVGDLYYSPPGQCFITIPASAPARARAIVRQDGNLLIRDNKHILWQHSGLARIWSGDPKTGAVEASDDEGKAYQLMANAWQGVSGAKPLDFEALPQGGACSIAKVDTNIQFTASWDGVTWQTPVTVCAAGTSSAWCVRTQAPGGAATLTVTDMNGARYDSDQLGAAGSWQAVTT